MENPIRFASAIVVASGAGLSGAPYIQDMNNVWRRVRGAIGMGLLWAAGGVLVGGMIELIMNILPGSDLFLGVDIWPAALAIPGFIGGVAFSMLIWLVEGRRKFEELTLPRFALWGGIVGFLTGVLLGIPVVATFAGAIVGSGCAVGSLALARAAKKREALGEGGDPPPLTPG